MSCIFCDIAGGKIPSQKVYEDDVMLAFKDLNPQAPVHVLLIPKSHIDSLAQIDGAGAQTVAHMMEKISAITKTLGCEESFRIVSNCGAQAGQSVMHLHFHLLAGRQFAWPPG